MITLPRNIPLYIHPSFWILALIIGWLGGSGGLLQFGSWVVVVFVSVLVHELGHALTARIWYKRVHIELGSMGGLTVRKDPSLGKAKEFLIVLMGPLFGLFLCGIAFLLLLIVPPIPTLIYLLRITVWANIFWTILNLMPVQPLDGGKLMGIILESLFGLKGVRYSYLVSAIVAIGLAVYFFRGNQFIPGAFFLLLTYESFRAFQSERHSRVSGEDQKFVDEIEKAEADWHGSQPERAIARLEVMIKNEATTAVSSSAVFYRALETLVGFLLASGQTQKAYNLLLPYKKNLSGQMQKQLQLASFKLGFWDESLKTGIKAFQEEQDSACAILNVFCLAHLGKVEEAVHWLRALKRDRMMGKGIDLPYILASEELDSIRQEPLFQEFATTCK